MTSQAELINILRYEGIADERVLKAIGDIPRHLFVPDTLSAQAYDNHALPIQCRQTISQPYVVACMTEAILKDSLPSKVLEIGTGSGYQAAILSSLVEHVYSVERIEELYRTAKQRLQDLHYDNVQVHYGDGMLGWAEHAPYDGIIVTAATNHVPEALKQQLADGGRMIIPVGDTFGQQLQLLTRHGDSFSVKYLESVVFVPLLPGEE